VVPVPEPVLSALLGRFGFPSLPKGALAHLKFPIVVDGTAFRAATGSSHTTSEVETLKRYRRISPV
jgi:UDP-glucose 4-epimerase